MQHLPRLLALSGILTLAACRGSGGGLGNIFGGGNSFVNCDPGAQVQLANPQPGASGVPTNIGQIIIVGNTDAGDLHANPTNWHLVLHDNFGNVFDSTSSLSLVDGHTLNHPYPNDFYYGASIPGLNGGMTYSVSLQQGTDGISCTPVPLQSFNT